MPEIQILLTDDELALLNMAYQQSSLEHESPEHFANATIHQAFIDIEIDLAGGPQGSLMT